MKNKKNIVFIIISTMIVLIVFVFIKEIDIFNKTKITYENTVIQKETQDSWSKDKIKMSVKNISKDGQKATLVIEDKNKIPVSWDTSYGIQRLSEANVWYDVKSNITMSMLMEIVTPSESGITEINLNWEDVYGKLRKGTYRIVKNKNFITLYSEPFKIN